MVNMRSFRKPTPGSGTYIFRRTEKSLALSVKFLHLDPFESVDHIDQIGPSVRIVKQGRVEAGTVQIYRLRPLPHNIICPHNVIVSIKIP